MLNITLSGIRVAAAALLVIEDITERRREEEKLQHLSRLYQLLLHSAGEGVYEVDMQERHTIVNTAAANFSKSCNNKDHD